MKIIYKTGDLFANKEPIIVHSCNIQGGFGSGVAGVIARLYPESRQTYIEAFQKGELELGKTIWSQTNTGIFIGHMICQPTMGGPDADKTHDRVNTRHVSYDAVDKAMRDLSFDFSKRADQKNQTNIAMPLIGSALGGGSWAVIAAIIEHRSKHFQPIVYTLDGNIPA